MNALQAAEPNDSEESDPGTVHAAPAIRATRPGVQTNARGANPWFSSLMSAAGFLSGLALVVYLVGATWRERDPVVGLLAGVAVLAFVGLRSEFIVLHAGGRAAALAYLVLGVAVGALNGGLEPLVVAACAGIAFLGAPRAPLVSTEARARFSPIAYRRTFLLASVVQVAIGIIVVVPASVGLRDWGVCDGRARLVAVILVSFGVALVLSAVGVLSMRAWGVLLALGTSLAMATLSLLVYVAGLCGLAGLDVPLGLRDEGRLSIVFALGALVPLGVVAPVVLARLMAVLRSTRHSTNAEPGR